MITIEGLSDYPEDIKKAAEEAGVHPVYIYIAIKDSDMYIHSKPTKENIIEDARSTASEGKLYETWTESWEDYLKEELKWNNGK